MSGQEKQVRDFFERTDVYLRYNYNLRIRFETVRSFVGENHFYNVLDMPCGTGEITLPLLDRFDSLTLMDFSSNMVETARSHIPPDQAHKVNLIHENFYHYDFDKKEFDLVVSLGILAHIDDPWRFLDLLTELVAPGGKLVIQNTDSRHWFSRLIRFYLGFRQLTGKDKYRLNKVPARELEKRLKEKGFKKLRSFRYNQSFLGFSRLFSNDLKYRLTRNYYGDAEKQKNPSHGSDITYLFERIS